MEIHTEKITVDTLLVYIRVLQDAIQMQIGLYDLANLFKKISLAD